MKTYKDIGIITDSIRGNNTGIGYFAMEFVKSLNKTISQFKCIDYMETAFNKKKLLLIPTIFPIFKTYSWAHLLPIMLGNNNFDFIINLTGIPHFFRFKAKEIFFVYDISWLLLPQTHPFSRVILNKLFFARTLSICHKIVTISENTKLDIIKHYGVSANKITVIYPNLPFLSESERKPRVELPSNYILFVSTIEPRKNIATILRALHKLKKEGQLDTKLVISGKNGWKYKGIYNLVLELNLSKDVIFTGYVTNEEKRYLYNHARLFVYPSLYEGFGIPPLEAMYCGCPVITSNVSSLPEVVGKSAISIDPLDYSTMADEIFKVVSNDLYRDKIVLRQNIQVKKFLLLNIPKNLFK